MALTINGERVPDSTLDRELLRLSSGLEMDAPRAGGLDPAQLRSLALRNVIERTLLLQAAVRHEIRVTPEDVKDERLRRWGAARSSVCDQRSMDSLREDLMLDRLSTFLTRHVPRPGRLDVERAYRANLHEYRVPEAVEAAHILCSCAAADEEAAARMAIGKAADDLRRGVPFAQVADRYSDCKGVGGSVGWVARGSMVQEFEEVIFAMTPNAHSPIFRTVFGFHIATIRRHRKASVLPLEQVKLHIAKRLHDQAQASAFQGILAHLRAESDIRYGDDSAHG